MDNRQDKEKKFWDKFAKNYDTFVKKTVDQTYKSILANIDLELDISKSVLEIGTGTGIILATGARVPQGLLCPILFRRIVRIAKGQNQPMQIQNITIFGTCF